MADNNDRTRVCKIYKDMLDNNVRFRADLINQMYKYQGEKDMTWEHYKFLLEQTDKNIGGYYYLYKRCEG